MKLQTAVLAGATVALALTSTHGASPRADYKPPAAGSTWVQQTRNSGSYGDGVSESQVRMRRTVWKGQDALAFESAQGTLVERDAQWLATLAPDGKPAMTWDPPIGWDWPLEVGKSWKRKYSVTIHAQGVTVSGEYTGTVDAFEDVTVPAGTFKAFRVSTSDTLGINDTTWWSPELGIVLKRVLVRTEKNAVGPGRRETVVKTVGAAR